MALPADVWILELWCTFPLQDPNADGAFVKASSVQLRDRMRVSDEEPMRQACWEVG